MMRLLKRETSFWKTLSIQIQQVWLLVSLSGFLYPAERFLWIINSIRYQKAIESWLSEWDGIRLFQNRYSLSSTSLTIARSFSLYTIELEPHVCCATKVYTSTQLARSQLAAHSYRADRLNIHFFLEQEEFPAQKNFHTLLISLRARLDLFP